MKNRPLFVLMATCFSTSLAWAAPADREVQILVKPSPNASEAALHALLSTRGGREHSAIEALNVRVIRVPENAAPALPEALGKSKDVEYVEPEFTAQAVGTSNDPFFTAGNQWALSKIQAPLAWDQSTGSSNVVVAVVDSGVWASHPDLAGKVLPGYDFVNNDADSTDDAGHGTAVAGVIGAATNNGVGMAGVTWANRSFQSRFWGRTGVEAIRRSQTASPGRRIVGRG